MTREMVRRTGEEREGKTTKKTSLAAKMCFSCVMMVMTGRSVGNKVMVIMNSNVASTLLRIPARLSMS